MAEDHQRVHVDIDQVQSSADIQPVDGIRSSGQPDAQEFANLADSGYVAVVELIRVWGRSKCGSAVCLLD